MTSANLFFNLMKENLRQRLWEPVLALVVMFFALPVSLSMMLNNYDISEMEPVRIGEILQDWVTACSIFMLVVIFVGAFICGINGFAYLTSRQRTDFYHSLPVKRETLFLVTWVNGFLFYVVPYLIMMLLAIVVAAVSGIGVAPGFPGTILHMMWIHFLLYLMIYSTIVLAMMVTSNRLLAVFGAGVLLFYGNSLQLISDALCAGFYETFVEGGFFRNAPLFSPGYLAIRDQIQIARVENMTMPQHLPWILGLTVVAFLLSLLMYHYRPSETAGNALVFPFLKPVLEFLLIIPAALGLGMVFGLITDGSFRSGWFIFGIICGIILIHALYQVLVDYDIKSIIKGKRCLSVCTFVIFLVCCVFWFDLTGFDKWVPKENKVESVAVDMGLSSFYYSSYDDGDILKSMKCTDPETIQAAIALADYMVNHDAENRVSRTCYIRYQMKNGSVKTRRYNVVLQDCMEFASKIYRDKTFKEENYGVLKLPENRYQVDLYNIVSDSTTEILDETQSSQLLKTYQEELGNLELAALKEEYPMMWIYFYPKNVGWPDDDMPEYGARGPIYPSFTKTLELLEEYDISIEADIFSRVKKAVVSTDVYKVYDESTKSYSYQRARGYIDSESDYIYEEKTYEVKDKKQLKELYDALVMAGGPVEYGQDSLIETESGFYVELYYEPLGYEIDGGYEYISAWFRQGQVPEFVMKGLEIQE